MAKNGTLTGVHSTGLFVIVLAMLVLAPWAASAGRPLITWFVSLLLVLAFLLVAAHGVTGLWRGMIVDDRNVISLSRFQMAVWTVIVLSAYLAAASWNWAVGYDEPLRFALPTELWLLMGISTVSLVGSPLLLSAKRGKEPSDDEKRHTFELLAGQGDSLGTLSNKGQLVANTDPAMARWSDMFTGEETGNAAHLDLSRVQMFFFTLIVALAYSLALGKMFAQLNAGGIEAFPGLDEGILALIGISHGGYLVSKGIPHSEAKSIRTL